MKDELTCNGFDFLLGLALVLVGVHVKPARTLSICCACCEGNVLANIANKMIFFYEGREPG